MPVTFSCSSCSVKIKAPDTAAGKKAKCPSCGEIVSVPDLDTSPPADIIVPQYPPPALIPPHESDDVENEEQRPSRRRSRDYDDRDDDDEPYTRIARRRSRRDDEDDYDDDYGRRSGSSRGFRCPFCRSKEPPVTRSQISAAGWVTFAVMILLCWPLFWIGLLIKEEYRECYECGSKIGG